MAWCASGADGRVRLTAAGLKIARKLTERHHLIERMLCEIFGMEWYQVHDEAERLEHAVSPDFEAKLVAKLGRGRPCPHGNLSELESPASRRRRGLVLLSEAEAGKSYAVSGIYERDRRAPGIPRSARNPSRRKDLASSSATTTKRSLSERPMDQRFLDAHAAERIWVSPLSSRPV